MATPKVIKKEVIATGKWLKLILITYIDQEGRERTWEAVERTGNHGAAIIIPVTKPEWKLILIKQFRPAAGAYLIEFPAGLIDEGESAADSAIRELYEETGYTGKVVNCSSPSLPSAGASGETHTMVEVEVDTTLPENQNPVPELEDSEFIEVFTVSKDEIKPFLEEQTAQGCLIDTKITTYLHCMGIIC